MLCAICDKKLYIIVFLAVTSPLVISMFEDMKINTNTSIKMDMKVTCTFFTWPLPLFDTDMDMDIIKDIDMNEHLHVYELDYEKVHVHVNVMFPLTFHHGGGAKRFLDLGSVEVTHPKVLAHNKPWRSKTL